MQLLFLHDDHDQLMIMSRFGVNWGQPRNESSKQKTKLYSKYTYNMYTPENMCLVIAKLKLWNMFFPAVTNRPLTIFFETLDIYLQRVSSLDAIFCSCGKTFFFLN